MLWMLAVLCGVPQAGVERELNNVGFRVLDFRYAAGREERTVTTAVWYPTSARPERHVYGGPTAGLVAVDAEPLASSGPFPLLVFSHGYGGSGIGYVFLAEALAARGWIVAAPDHNDRDSAVRIRTGPVPEFNRVRFLRHATEISRSGPADREAYAYRWDEQKLVLDRMVEDETFGSLIDPRRIAVGGHSFGGFTALGLCGTIESRRDERIQAVLIFSSGAAGYLFREEELAAVRMPSMLFLGEAERETPRGDRMMAEIAETVFGCLPKPKYFLEIEGANHLSFNNNVTDRPSLGTEESFDVILRYSIAFLERHVRDRAEAEGVLEARDRRLTQYRVERE